MLQKKVVYLFLVASCLLAPLLSAQTCARGRLTRPKEDVNYDESIAHLSLPFCNSQGRDGDPVYYRYGGGYTVWNSPRQATSTACFQGQEALFDSNARSSWYRRPRDERSVVFETEYISPFAVAIWNSGTGDGDVKDTRLDVADSAKGPWSIVRQMTLSAFYDESTPQVFLINNTKLGAHKFWRFSILSTWSSPASTALRELSFYVQPTARRSPTNFTSPSPFYVTNRNAILYRDLRTDPILNLSTTSIPPYSLVIFPNVYHWEEAELNWSGETDEPHRMGVVWTAESAKSGLTNFVLQTWDYENWNKTRAAEVICRGRSEGRRKAGMCLSSQWPKESLYLFSTTDVATSVKLSSFHFLWCDQWQCTPQIDRGVSVLNARTNQSDVIDTISVLSEEKCTVTFSGPSTAILF